MLGFPKLRAVKFKLFGDLLCLNWELVSPQHDSFIPSHGSFADYFTIICCPTSALVQIVCCCINCYFGHILVRLLEKAFVLSQIVFILSFKGRPDVRFSAHGTDNVALSVLSMLLSFTPSFLQYIIQYAHGRVSAKEENFLCNDDWLDYAVHLRYCS